MNNDNRKKILFINHVPTLRLNIGLTYVMTAVAGNYQVFFCNITFKVKEFVRHLSKKINLVKPDFICFSVNSFSFKSSLEWAGFCKKIAPDAKILMGGVHATLFPAETLKYPQIDYVCVGEGEVALLEFLNSYQKNKDLLVNGVWGKDKRKKILKTPLRPFIENPDSLPFPDWNYWDMEKYLSSSGAFKGGLRVLASRGCPYSCSFCSCRAIAESCPGVFYRVRDPECVVNEIEEQFLIYQPKGASYIHFEDACFGFNKDQLNKFRRLIKNRKLNGHIYFSCKANPAFINQQWVELVKEAGCLQVSVGIESADQHIRNNIYNKKVKDSKVAEVIKRLKSAGLLYSLYFMVCPPQGNLITFLKNLKMIIKHEPLMAFISFYHPLPKTELGEKIVTDFDFENIGEHVFSRHYRAKEPKFFILAGFYSVMVKLFKLSYFLIKGFKLGRKDFVKSLLTYELKPICLKSGIRKDNILADIYRKNITEIEFNKMVKK